MLAVAQILIPHPDEGGVGGQLTRQTVESRRVPGNRRHDDESGRLEDAKRFSQRRLAVGGRRQMVERPHQQNRGGKAIGLRKAPRVRD